MTRREAERLTRQDTNLMVLGFTQEEADRLRRISNTLNRWYEMECGNEFGAIERDETTGKPFWINALSGRRYATSDRERGALKRLAGIMAGRAVSYYVQTDPRGAALYILRPGDVIEGQSVDSCYSRGLCVY